MTSAEDRIVIVKALRLFLRHQEYDCDCRGCTDIIEALTPEEPRRTVKRVVGRRIVEVPLPPHPDLSGRSAVTE